MLRREAVALNREVKHKRAEFRNFQIAWHHLSLGWRIILVLGVFAAFWIVFQLIYSLRNLIAGS